MKELAADGIPVAVFDAHRDDPEFDSRFLADEARDSDQTMAARTAWRICSANGWFSRFGKKPKRGKGDKVRPPVHDDLVQQNFTADAPNRLWLADITEHRTPEGKLHCCAVKDVFSGRIAGYSIDRRMKSHIAVNAVNSAVKREATSPTVCFTPTGAVSFAAGNTSRRCTVTALWDQ